MNIFTLTKEDGSFYPPFVQSAVMAKYSRSSSSAKEILKEVDEKYGSDFNQKWAVKKGHDSLLELVTVPICLEDISIFASMFIENMKRPAFIERSTRYQKMEANNVIYNNLGKDSIAFVSKLFEYYEKYNEKLVLHFMNEGLSEQKAKLKTYDIIRYFVPIGMKTSIGMLINSRDLIELIRRLKYMSKYSEFVKISEKLNDVSKRTFGIDALKMSPIYSESIGFFPIYDTESNYKKVKLVDSSIVGDDIVLDKEIVEYMYSRKKKDPLPIIFNNIRYKFMVTTDFGSYRDLHRHRMTDWEFDTMFYEMDRPYDIPYEFIDEIDVDLRKVGNMAKGAVDNENLYCIPLGMKTRVFASMSLSQLYYMVELRSQPGGHKSYIEIAREMHDIAVGKHPVHAKWIKV